MYKLKLVLSLPQQGRQGYSLRISELFEKFQLFVTTLVQGAPWCYFPPDYGYVMMGEPVTSPLGYIVHLVRSTQAGILSEDI